MRDNEKEIKWETEKGNESTRMTEKDKEMRIIQMRKKKVRMRENGEKMRKNKN